MSSFNQVILLGNVTRDVECRFTPKGTAIAEFGLAINHIWRDEGGTKHEEVTFVDCTAFGAQAKVAGEYVKKGDPLHVSGRLKMDSWEDKQTGAKRTKLKVVVSSLQLLGSKKDSSSHETKTTNQKPKQQEEGWTGDEEPDEIDMTPAGEKKVDCPY